MIAVRRNTVAIAIPACTFSFLRAELNFFIHKSFNLEKRVKRFQKDSGDQDN